MGYRSEVAVGLTDNAVRLLEAIIKHDKELKELCEESRGTIEFPAGGLDPTKDHGGILYWDYIKWDAFYPDIGALETLLATVPDEDYRLVRVGEDVEDNEERGYFYDSEIYINRSISW